MAVTEVDRFEACWRGRKVARLPSQGVLIVGTDLQGNYDDYAALKSIYRAERELGHDPVLLLCGDLVHGPSEALAHPDRWPDFLGAFYVDRSVELIEDFIEFCRTERAFSLIGNHEHAHVGGPIVSKFHPDEAAVLEARLGKKTETVRAFIRSLPLLAVADCGAVFCHGAPRATEASVEAFERLEYDGYRTFPIGMMHDLDALGSLLWSRHAEPSQARRLLGVLLPQIEGEGFVVFGHDVVREGFERNGREQLCLSTSFGCEDHNKFYLRLDLSKRYTSVDDLRVGHELLRLYPDAR